MSPGIFRTTVALNIYENDDPEELGTQVSAGRFVEISTGRLIAQEKNGKSLGKFMAVRLCEDGYEGLLRFGDYLTEVLVSEPFTPNRVFARVEILSAIPNVIAFLFQAMQTPNRYLWGGTLGPHFDCSGLVQAAFASQGIWLQRNAQHQFDFTSGDVVKIEEAVPGDLLFFSHVEFPKEEKGKAERTVDHVGVHLGNGFFLHSSGPTLGRDGIGIDRLAKDGGRVAANYFPVYRSCHQVCSAWPKGDS